MSQFSGPAFRGAMRKIRDLKRAEAEERNAATPEERRKRNRKREPAGEAARRKQ